MLFVNQQITLDLVPLGHVVHDPLDVARGQLEEDGARRGARVVGHVAEDAPGTYAVHAYGANVLMDASGSDAIDWERSTSNDIWEVYHSLGIEAAAHVARRIAAERRLGLVVAGRRPGPCACSTPSRSVDRHQPWAPARCPGPVPRCRP